MWLGALFKCKANISFQPHFTSLFQFTSSTIAFIMWSFVIIFCDDTYKYSLRQKSAQFRIAPSQDTLATTYYNTTTHPSIQQRQYFLILHRQTYMNTFSFGNELTICASIYNLGQSGPSYYKNQDYTIWKYYMGFLKFLNCLIGLDYDM